MTAEMKNKQGQRGRSGLRFILYLIRHPPFSLRDLRIKKLTRKEQLVVLLGGPVSLGCGFLVCKSRSMVFQQNTTQWWF